MNKVAVSENRIDEMSEVVINVVNLSELLIDEMEKFSTTRLYSAGVKNSGRAMLKALEKSTERIYTLMGKDASEQFAHHVQEFGQMFDFIRQMAVKDRIELRNYLNEKYGEGSKGN